MRIFTAIILIITATGGHADGFDRRIIHDSRLERSDQAITRPKTDKYLVSTFGTTVDADVLISESVAPARFGQDAVTIAVGPQNVMPTAWIDEREGNDKIFFQAVDSLGEMIGSNQVVSESAFGERFTDPIVHADTAGRVLLFYRNQSRGLIIGEIRSSHLANPDIQYIINDTIGGSYAGPFDAAIYPDGRSVVVWENYQSGSSSIAVKMFNVDGTVLLPQKTVNTDTDSVDHWVPSVAVVPDGGFVVAWEDYRFGRADIFVRPYNGAGSALGYETSLVPLPVALADQFAPAIAYSEDDGFLIAWIDRRAGQEVYAQRYDISLGLVGGNMLLSGSDPPTAHWHVDLATTSQGEFSAIWAAFGQVNNILVQKFDPGVIPAGIPASVNVSTLGSRWSPALAYDSDQRVAIGWTESILDETDIHFTRLNSDLTQVITPETVLNDDTVGAVSADPRVVASTEWWNLVVFSDQRRDVGDIYLQTTSRLGDKAGVNQRVCQDEGYNLQDQPALDAQGNRALIVWVDGRDIGGIPGQRVFGRYCSPDGVLGESEFVISGAGQTSVKRQPQVVLNDFGRGLVVWLDQRQATPQIYGRWLAPDQSLEGEEFMITSPPADSTATSIHVGTDDSDRFFVTWLEQGQVPTVLKGVWFDSEGDEGGRFLWSPSTPGSLVDDFAVDINRTGEIGFVWVDHGGSNALNLTILDRTGTIVEPSQNILDDPEAIVSDLGLSISNNDYYVATWIDQRNARAMTQILSDQFVAVGNNQPISSADAAFMQSPSVYAYRGRARYVWVDPRADGLNVYYNSIVYLSTDADDGNTTVLPQSFSLSQNYPNPFNPTTEIGFSLPHRANMALTVLDLLGRQVAIIASGSFEAGRHIVTWDGADDTGARVASGVYFYRLDAGSFSQTRKMVLLK